MSTFVDRLAGLNSGVSIKAPVRVRTTGPVTLSGLQTIDGVTLLATDTPAMLRVLVANQGGDNSQNGLYDVPAQGGAWTRCRDFDGNTDLVQGTIVPVISGNTGQGWWIQNSPIPSTFQIGITGNPITFETFYAFAFLAGIGLLNGSPAAPSLYFAADPDTGIYSPGEDMLSVAANGTEVVRFGLQTIPAVPVGNPVTTLSSLMLQASDVGGGTGYEYASVITMTTTHNTGSVAPNKVAGYFGATNNNASGGNIWSLNSVNTLGASSPAGVASTGYEIDVNNLSGTPRTYSNLSAPSYGLQITGASTSANTAAILISGASGQPQWTAGVVWNNFRSANGAQYGLDLAFDLNNTFGSNAIRLPNNASIGWVNAAVNAVYTGIALSNANVWMLASGTSTSALINQNAATAQAALAGTMLQISGVDGGSGGASRLLLDAFAAQPILTFRRADGTGASPSAVQNGDPLAIIQVFGWAGSPGAYSAASRAGLQFTAAETWGTSNQGALIQFFTTPAGGVATAEAMRINASGGLAIGSPFTDAGLGGLFVAGVLNSVGTVELNMTRSVASGANATLDALLTAAGPVTITGSTAITNANGFNAVSLYAPTYTASAAAVAITNAATFYIGGAPATSNAGGFTPTIANAYALWVAGGITRLDGGILGVTNASNATAGTVGEYISSNIASGSAVSVSTGTPKDITSISLTAGDWDVEGNVIVTCNGTTTFTQVLGWINTTSATQPTLPGGGAYVEIQWASFAPGAGSVLAVPVGRVRINVSSTQTVFLTTQVAFATSTATAYGFIGARRRR